MKNRLFYFNFLRKTYIFSARQMRKILGLKDEPNIIARGVSIGLFVAFTPTIPLQMILSFLIAWIFRANKTAAVIPAWVTNPITALPIFYLEYLTGCLILWRSSITYDKFMVYMNKVSEFSIMSPMILYDQIMSLLKETWLDIGIPLVIGSLIWAIIIAIVSYPLSIKAIIRYRNRKEKLKEKWKNKKTTNLENS